MTLPRRRVALPLSTFCDRELTQIAPKLPAQVLALRASGQATHLVTKPSRFASASALKFRASNLPVTEPAPALVGGAEAFERSEGEPVRQRAGRMLNRSQLVALQDDLGTDEKQSRNAVGKWPCARPGARGDVVGG